LRASALHRKRAVLHFGAQYNLPVPKLNLGPFQGSVITKIVDPDPNPKGQKKKK
jgi:hypothetical protein